MHRLAELSDLEPVFAIYMDATVVPFLGYDPIPIEAFQPIFRELVESRDQLREWLGPGAPVDGMAYPYGLSEHYSNTTADLAREVGYRWAAANIADVMRPTTGVFDLRRASVTNLNGDAFKRWLGWWFGL